MLCGSCSVALKSFANIRSIHVDIGEGSGKWEGKMQQDRKQSEHDLIAMIFSNKNRSNIYKFHHQDIHICIKSPIHIVFALVCSSVHIPIYRLSRKSEICCLLLLETQQELRKKR